jgi:alpha-beta hydrolase superfamily lysophospholipase
VGALRWGEADRSTKGVVERRFAADVSGRVVPGLLWHGADVKGPRPLVLLGHGATRHKRVEYLLALARLLVRRHGIAAAAIDGPGHGDRRQGAPVDDVVVFGEFLAEWSRPGTTDDVVAEWAAVLTGLREADEVGDGPLGYWGLSMGTIYGIPLAAAEPRIQAAVFGLMGLVGPTQERMATDAAALACPVLFLAQWDDSLIPRQHAFELFDAIGSLDKRLHAHPGEHAAVPAEELEFSARFLARHLEGSAPGD